MLKKHDRIVCERRYIHSNDCFETRVFHVTSKGNYDALDKNQGAG